MFNISRQTTSDGSVGDFSDIAGSATPPEIMGDDVTDSTGNSAKMSLIVDGFVAIITYVVLVVTWLIMRRMTSYSVAEEEQPLRSLVRRQRSSEAVNLLPGDVIVYTAGCIVAMFSIINLVRSADDVDVDNVLSFLCRDKPSRVVQLAAAASVGHFLYRLTLLAVTSSACRKWSGFDIYGYAIGIMVAVTGDVTETFDGAMVAGLLYQVPLLMFSISRALRHRPGCVSGSCHWILYVVGLLAAILFMLVTSVVILGYRYIYCETKYTSDSSANVWMMIVYGAATGWMPVFAIWFIYEAFCGLCRRRRLANVNDNYYDENCTAGYKPSDK